MKRNGKEHRDASQNKWKELRNKTGLTQKEFTEILKIPTRTYQEWEQGRQSPPEYVYHMSCRILASYPVEDSENKWERLRHKAGLSQKAFSKILNIPISRYREWEAGEEAPPEYVYRICERIQRAYPRETAERNM